jgi:hypothetical protein
VLYWIHFDYLVNHDLKKFLSGILNFLYIPSSTTMSNFFEWYIEFRIYSLFNHNVNNFWVLYWILCILVPQSQCKQLFDWYIESAYYFINHDVNIIWMKLLNLVHIHSSPIGKRFFEWYIEFRLFSLFSHDVNNFLTNILNYVFSIPINTM